jgi:hypothetical protein
MIFYDARFLARTLAVALLASLIWTCNAAGQSPIVLNNSGAGKDGPGRVGATAEANSDDDERWTNNYVDPVQGASSDGLIRRALQSNAELAAARLDYERGRARLRQAGLRPNHSPAGRFVKRMLSVRRRSRAAVS